jgi:hypothetical protein
VPLLRLDILAPLSASTLRDQIATNRPSEQVAMATKSEKTVRRIVTGPNGWAQAAMNRTKPTARSASVPIGLANSAVQAAGLMERALMFQYTQRKTQQARISVPVSITCILSPQNPQGTQQGRRAANVGSLGF